MFLARLPGTGELAYMSQANTVIETSYAIYYGVTETLTQITTTPIDTGSSPLVPFIGFSENNIWAFA
jgi:hypothetical protein